MVLTTIRRRFTFAIVCALFLTIALPISTFAAASIKASSRAISITNASSATEAGYYLDLRNASVQANGVSGYFTVSAVCGSCPTVQIFLGIGSTGFASVGHGGVAWVGVDQQKLQAFYFVSPEDTYHYPFAVKDGDSVLAQVYLDTSTGSWGIHIEDSNSGGFFQQEFNIAPDKRFVDFLVKHDNTNDPLPSFNTINFGPANWTASNGNDQPIDSSASGVATVQETLNDPSGGSACPSAISDGSYFSVSKC